MLCSSAKDFGSVLAEFAFECDVGVEPHRVRRLGDSAASLRRGCYVLQLGVRFSDPRLAVCTSG